MATQRQQEALIAAVAAQYMVSQDTDTVSDDVVAFVREEVQQYDLDESIVESSVTNLADTVQEIM